MRRRFKKRLSGIEIFPDETLLDSSNLPDFDRSQFEGRIEKPISKLTLASFGAFVFIILGILLYRAWDLQIAKGEEYLALSENNRLQNTIIFPARGIIYDRSGERLAWNDPLENLVSSTTYTYAKRNYTPMAGFAHVLGHISYPKVDSSGIYFQDEIIGLDGVELIYNDKLKGVPGLKIIETDALGEVLSEAVIKEPEDGQDLILTIDFALQQRVYSSIKSIVEQVGFEGGAVVIMDVTNGEIISLVSYPEYDPQILSDGVEASAINAFINSSRKPFLNRVVSGLYAPGSTIKPFIALRALEEEVITPTKNIYSSGSIEIPNPYYEDLVSVFNDWKAHGWVDMREALAVSSNVYFFEISGGFEEQRGIGIAGIENVANLFGLGETTGIDLPEESIGVIPSPAWKEKVFPGDPWRVGDTYNTSIGQYGFQVTAIAAARAMAAIANGGILVTPHITADSSSYAARSIDIDESDLDVVHDGLRRAVTSGTAQALNLAGARIAAKSGTAEVGITKKRVNSWVNGYFPYDNPKYAFSAVMERGPRNNIIGAGAVMNEVFKWIAVYEPEYLK